MANIEKQARFEKHLCRICFRPLAFGFLFAGLSAEI
jgi:ribosomal protein S14